MIFHTRAEQVHAPLARESLPAERSTSQTSHSLMTTRWRRDLCSHVLRIQLPTAQSRLMRKTTSTREGEKEIFLQDDTFI